MKRILPILLILCLLFTGCGKDDTVTEPSTEATTESTTEATTEATTESTTESTEESTTGTVIWGTASPLTGLVSEEATENRPYAVVINNIIDAMPQCGIRDASIIYEVLAEGGVTRCLAIFEDVEATGPIGSVRSARPYMVDLAMAYDAIFVHAGGSDDAYSEISATDIDHIDGVKGSNSGAYFYRDQERLDSGYALEHTMFITGKDIIAYATERGCTLTRPGGVNYGYLFSDTETPNGESAQSITIAFEGSKKRTYFTYHADTGLYTAEQHDMDYLDGITGEPITFRNVIMITADTGYDSKGYRLDIDLVDEGEGWYACGGKMIPILWSREDNESPFVYTYIDGTPLTLGSGATYIAVSPYGSEMICE